MNPGAVVASLTCVCAVQVRFGNVCQYKVSTSGIQALSAQILKNEPKLRLFGYTCSFHTQAEFIKPCLSRQIERLVVSVAPRHIVRVHWRDDRSQVLTFRGDDP